jgi:hypothetical protein
MYPIKCFGINKTWIFGFLFQTRHSRDFVVVDDVTNDDGAKEFDDPNNVDGSNVHSNTCSTLLLKI